MATVIYLGRERMKRRHKMIVSLARGMRSVGMPLRDALQISTQLVETSERQQNQDAAGVLRFRR